MRNALFKQAFILFMLGSPFGCAVGDSGTVTNEPDDGSASDASSDDSGTATTVDRPPVLDAGNGDVGATLDTGSDDVGTVTLDRPPCPRHWQR